MEISPVRLATYNLTASQILPIGRKEAFEFFRNPANLGFITPPWLQFTMLQESELPEVRENAEFNYKISWLGIRIRWRSRIVNYDPPSSFTDIQVKGPYRSWVHVHTLEDRPDGTQMLDSVDYTLPLPAVTLHRHFIKKSLEDIFRFRAVKIDMWANGA
jgi:hypothetical protein